MRGRNMGQADPKPEIARVAVQLVKKPGLHRDMTQHPETGGRHLVLSTNEFNQWEIRDRLLSHDRLPSAEKRV